MNQLKEKLVMTTHSRDRIELYDDVSMKEIIPKKRGKGAIKTLRKRLPKMAPLSGQLPICLPKEPRADSPTIARIYSRLVLYSMS